MDRFEAWGFKYKTIGFQIYIPVWIDLKFSFSSFLTLHYSHLHSSMDRFEAIPVGVVIVAENDLHSSMDRFEVP